MPIVLICNPRWEIIWTDNKLCSTVDCGRHPVRQATFAAFLGVSPETFAAKLGAHGANPASFGYVAALRHPDGRELTYQFRFEHVPSFDGLDGAAVIVVGICDPAEDKAAAAVGYPLGGAREAHPLGVATRTYSGRDLGTQAGDPLREAYRYSNLRLEDGAKLFSRLQRLVDAEELYRDNSFTLEMAASRLETNALYVSQITNFFSSASFPNFLNHKRYEALQRALQADPDADFKEAWQSAGFGSYSSLNRYLKSVKGVSPSEFRRALAGERLPSREEE